MSISNDVTPREAEVREAEMSASESRAAEPSWVPVCSISELEPFWGEAALIDGRQVALFLLPQAVIRAVSNQDPLTMSFVMSRGIVGSRGDRATVASPLNKRVYDLETGECLSAEGPALSVFPVRVVAGAVEVGLWSA